MMIVLIFIISVIDLTLSAWSPGGSTTQPNIIYILADDLGYNDISYQNPDILTPTMESLSSQGVKFSQFYVQPTCSPSRSALLSGKYPIHTGFNTGAIGWAQNKGLETEHMTLAERLSSIGYTNHMLGKWHIGWCKNDYLPHYRGFKTFNGIYLAGTDHYNYQSTEQPGYDLHTNDSPNLADNGTYSSILYGNKAQEIIKNHDTSNPLFLYVALQNIHSPLQVPREYLRKYRGKAVRGKRKLASAMVTSIDEVVDKIYNALDDKNILDNSIIVFSSDNGGQPKAGGASNTPLRGGKNSWWEGGIRVPSWMYSPLFTDGTTMPLNQNNTCLFHISDWYTTIYRMAGGNVTDLNVDGLDQWSSITNGACSRTELLHNIHGSDSAYRYQNYKLIIGDTGSYNDWYDASNNVVAQGNVGSTTEFLFDVIDDPNETNNLAQNNPDLVKQIKAKISSLSSEVVSYSNGPRCDYSDAVNSDLIWTPDCCR